MLTYSNAYAEIDLGALADNYKKIAEYAHPAEIIAVVKADAYGHGVERCSHALYNCGCRFFAVATANEALQMRRLFSDCEILILGNTPNVELANILSDNDGLTEEVATVNGRDFMDDWLTFVNKNGLTREYFDSEVKAPLSELMKMYQTRHLDEQSVFTDFLSDTKNGLPYMVAINAFMDLITGGYGGDIEEALSNFLPYQELVRIIKGTATDADVDDFVAHLANYVGQYSDYQAMLGGDPPISPEELETIRTNLSLLVKALAPLIIADAKYTQETFGEDYSLYYTYSLIKNAEALVIGHIPESMMKNLKDLIPEDEEDIVVPNSGANTYIQRTETTVSYSGMISEIIIASLIGSIVFVIRPSLLANKK